MTTDRAPERTYNAFPFTDRVSTVLVVLRDPDASNTFAAFERQHIGSFGVSIQGDLFVHDIDAGGPDLRDHDEYHEWSEHHLGTAATLRTAGFEMAAAMIEDVVNNYAPDGYDPDAMDEEDEDACTECGEPTSDGEGYDGLCGNCADKEDDEDPLTDEERERRDTLNLAMERNPDIAFTASDMEDF